MNSVDAWWNRNFPPYSIRRLLFLLALTPLIVGLAWLTGQLTIVRYAFLNLVAVVMVAVSYLVARKAAHHQASALSPVRGPHHVGSPSPHSPHPGNTLQLQPMAQLARPRGGLSRTADFAITFMIMFAGMAIFLGLILGGPVIASLPGALGAALLITLSLVFRYSLWPIALISIAAGYPAALLMYLFLFWSGGGITVYGYWAFTSIGVFCFLAPGWFRMRAIRPILDRLSIPSWAITSTVSLLMVLAGAFISLEDDSPSRAPDPVGVATAPVEERFGAASPRQAAEILTSAWQSGSTESASRVASARAVEELFKIPPDAASGFTGCGTTENGWSRCGIGTSTELILLSPQKTRDGNSYIGFIERRPLDYPITYVATNP